MTFIRYAPIIGPWIFRCSVGKTGKRAIDGDHEAVRELCDLICSTEDERVRNIATSALSSLKTPNTIRVLLENTLVRNHPSLFRLAPVYLSDPRRAIIKALFLFATGNMKDFHTFDPSPHSLFSRGYTEADFRVRRAVCMAAKKHTLQQILSNVLREGLHNPEDPCWTDDEWEAVFIGLIGEARWEVLFKLVFSAPLPQAIDAIHSMKDAGWRPSGDDRYIWDTVIRTLPSAWTYPLPSGNPSLTIGSDDSLVTRSTFSPDGLFLAIGFSDGRVQIWQVRSGTLLSTHKTGDDAVVLLTFSRDNSFLIYGVGPGRITCINIESGEIRWEYCCAEKWTGIHALAPDRSFIVTCGTSGRIIVLSILDGIPIRTFPGFESPASAFTVFSSDPALIVGCDNGSVRSVRISDGFTSTILPPGGDPVKTLSANADGESIIVIFTCNQPLVVNCRGQRIMSFSGYSGIVKLASITAGGTCFAVSGTGPSITVWQTGSGNPLMLIPVYNRKITCCLLSPDATLLAEGTSNGTIRMIRINGTPVTAWENRRHKKGIASLEFSPDGLFILSSGWDFSVRLWDVKTGDLVRTLDREAGEVTGIALFGAGAVIVAGYSSGSVRLYRRDTGECIRSFSCYTEVKKIASDSSGTTLACAGADGSLHLLSPGGNDLDSCEGTIPPPRCLAVLKGKNMVVTGGWDGLLRLISIPEAKTLETFPGHTSIITSCAVSADGKFIVTGSNDTTVRLWSRDSRKVLQIIRDSNSEVGALGISPDGYYFAAAGSDALIRIYSLPYGELVFSVPGISGAATGLAFSADGRILAAGYDTGTLLLISCPERKIVHTLRAHAAAVSTIAVTPDGLSLVTGGREGLVRVWDLPSGTSLAGKNTNDIAIAARQEHFSSQDSVRLQWGFLCIMLSARFRNAIELCTEPEETGMFDIGIVG